MSSVIFLICWRCRLVTQRGFRKRSSKCPHVLWFYSVFQARASDPTEPEPALLSASPGSGGVTNTGLFTALPSLVIMLLRAPAGLPRPQCSPGNVTWQSETFWKTSSRPLLLRPHWYLSADNFTVSLLANASQASWAPTYRAFAKGSWNRYSGLCSPRTEEPLLASQATSPSRFCVPISEWGDRSPIFMGLMRGEKSMKEKLLKMSFWFLIPT